MISDLAFYHPDPTWQQWARNEVELGKFDAGGLDLPLPAATLEVLPSPIQEPQLLMLRWYTWLNYIKLSLKGLPQTTESPASRPC